MKCSNHPRYRGVRKSTTGCLKCRLIFGLRRIASACGFSVAQAAPRKIKTPIPTAHGEPTRDYTFVGGPADGTTINLPCDATEHIYTASIASVSSCYIYKKYLNLDGAPIFHLVPLSELGSPVEPICKHDFVCALENCRSFLHIGGKDHGCITHFREDAPVIYDGYCLTHFADGSRAYVFANISYPFAERYLEQYRTTGDMKPCVDDAAPPQRYEKFLFVGGPANLQIREVGESHDSNGARPCELTMPYDLNIYIYRMRVTDWTSNPYPVAYVLDGTSDSELATQLEAYRSLGPLDSGGKLC